VSVFLVTVPFDRRRTPVLTAGYEGAIGTRRCVGNGLFQVGQLGHHFLLKEAKGAYPLVSWMPFVSTRY